MHTLHGNLLWRCKCNGTLFSPLCCSSRDSCCDTDSNGVRDLPLITGGLSSWWVMSLNTLGNPQILIRTILNNCIINSRFCKRVWSRSESRISGNLLSLRVALHLHAPKNAQRAPLRNLLFRILPHRHLLILLNAPGLPFSHHSPYHKSDQGYKDSSWNADHKSVNVVHLGAIKIYGSHCKWWL